MVNGKWSFLVFSFFFWVWINFLFHFLLCFCLYLKCLTCLKHRFIIGSLIWFKWVSNIRLFSRVSGTENLLSDSKIFKRKDILAKYKPEHLGRCYRFWVPLFCQKSSGYDFTFIIVLLYLFNILFWLKPWLIFILNSDSVRCTIDWWNKICLNLVINFYLLLNFYLGHIHWRHNLWEYALLPDLWCIIEHW